MSFPDRELREKCWSARDEFWKCLDDNNLLKPNESGPCEEFRQLFQNKCPSQWVKHFDRKFSYLKFKDKMNQGFDPIEETK